MEDDMHSHQLNNDCNCILYVHSHRTNLDFHRLRILVHSTRSQSFRNHIVLYQLSTSVKSIFTLAVCEYTSIPSPIPFGVIDQVRSPISPYRDLICEHHLSNRFCCFSFSSTVITFRFDIVFLKCFTEPLFPSFDTSYSLHFVRCSC